jgi:hypothetical protein
LMKAERVIVLGMESVDALHYLRVLRATALYLFVRRLRMPPD